MVKRTQPELKDKKELAIPSSMVTSHAVNSPVFHEYEEEEQPLRKVVQSLKK